MIFAVFQTLRSIRNWRNHLPNSSLCIRCKTGRQIGARHPLATSSDHIAAFFDARIAALTGAGIKPIALSLIPAWGFFWGLLPKPRSRCWRGSMNCGCASIPRCLLSVSRKSFTVARSQAVVPGDVGAATLAPELAAAAGGAGLFPQHTSRAPCATGWRYWRR